MRRRTLLRHVGVGAGAVVFAGCLDETGNDRSGVSDDSADTDSDDPTDDDSDGPTDDDSADPTDDDRSTRIVSESIDSEGECATGEEAAGEAIVTAEGETVAITGSLEAPNPCHDAVLETVEMATGELAVTVDVDPHDVEVCQECLARVTYEATIEFEGEPPETVTVSHAEIVGDDQIVEEGEEIFDDADE